MIEFRCPRFQVHLGTMVFLAIASGALLWLNMLPHAIYDTGQTFYGWPWLMIDTLNTKAADDFYSQELGFHKIFDAHVFLKHFILNAMIGFLCLSVLAYACERWSRQMKAAKAHRP